MIIEYEGVRIEVANKQLERKVKAVLFEANGGGMAEIKKVENNNGRRYTRRLGPNKPWSAEEHERLLELVRSGKKVRDIARELGRGYGSVSGRLSNHQLSLGKVRAQVNQAI